MTRKIDGMTAIDKIRKAGVWLKPFRYGGKCSLRAYQHDEKIQSEKSFYMALFLVAPWKTVGDGKEKR